MGSFEQIRKIIAEQANIEEDTITLDTTLEDLKLDSLDLFQILSDIEDATGVGIEDVEAVKGVRDIVNAVEAGK